MALRQHRVLVADQCAVIRVARNIEIGFRFSLDGLRIKADPGAVQAAGR